MHGVCVKAGDVYKPRDEKHIVSHYHYTSWPDKALPTKPELLVQFLCQVMNQQASYRDAGPIVVHCRLPELYPLPSLIAVDSWQLRFLDLNVLIGYFRNFF